MLSTLAEKLRPEHCAISRADHEATLRNIDAFFGEVVCAEQVQACWQPTPARLRAVT